MGFFKIVLFLLSFFIEYEIFINYFIFEYGGQIVLDVDGIFFVELIYVQFYEKDGNCFKYENCKIWNDKCFY